jgi:hypothetical protein
VQNAVKDANTLFASWLKPFKGVTVNLGSESAE